jgi:hypothetical protein
MSLAYINQQLIIYGGSFFLLMDLIGNGMNILSFSTVHTYRIIPCSFYFLVASIDNTFIYYLILLFVLLAPFMGLITRLFQ